MLKVRPRWRRIPYVIAMYRMWRTRPSVSRSTAFRIAWGALMWKPSPTAQQEHELIPAARMGQPQ